VDKKKHLLVQIGAGLSSGPSWISYDSSPTLAISKIPLLGPFLLKSIKGPKWPNSTRYADILKGLPLPEESCRLIFCSHMLEHLSLSDFKTALRKIYQYLEPSGTFRLIVPDLEAYAKRYTLEIAEGRRDHAATAFIKETYLGCESTRQNFASRLREALASSRHQWLWDRGSLTKALQESGFQNIHSRRFGEWCDPIFSEVEREDRHTDAICIECSK